MEGEAAPAAELPAEEDSRRPQEEVRRAIRIEDDRQKSVCSLKEPEKGLIGVIIPFCWSRAIRIDRYLLMPGG